MAKVSTRADMALIKGAADVGKSMMPADLSGLDKVTKAGTDMAVGAIGEIQKREQEKVDMYDAFTEAANEVELSSGALGDVLYNDTVDFAQEAKNSYLTALKAGDQKGMMSAKKAMQQRSQFTQQHKAFVTDLAKLQKDGDLSAAHTPEENAYMTAVLKGNYKVEKNEKGEMVFNVNGVKKTNAEFEDMYILKNYTMGKTLGELNGKNKSNSSFDRNAVMNTISQSLPKTEKEFRAALVDDLGGGEGFKDLLIKDKGLDQEALMAIGFTDPNGDGVIDEKEKDNFIAAITDHNNPNFNLDVSKRIMAEKMTQAVQNNHTAHWEGVALAAKNKIIQEQEMLDYKNRLAGDLDDEKSANRTEEAEAKFKNEKKLLKQKEDNLVNRDQNKKFKTQQDVETFWSEQKFDTDPEFREKGPVDKMKQYNEAIRTATGNNNINLKYSATPFEGAMGRSVQSGYYIVRDEDVVDEKTGEITGAKKAVKQVIGIGEDITAENIMSLIDPEKSIAFASNNLSTQGEGR